ncbi:hypothetical protein PPYR_14004 [Photinus pyralis]|uniref:Peptidase S1 domain-containing protein n=2 Tax=Photinus pyralis TaxID=7054 RepID=A0A5N4A3Z5_PHOPY|nr:hypothetical protein PPYR_14004 [Photinus pyralis]
MVGIDSSTGELVTICAGVLINQRYVVTPAECLLKERLPARVVQLGISYGGSNARITETTLRTFYLIQKEVLHPLYESKASQHNIALLRLNRLVHYTEYIQPICLPFHKKIPSLGSTVYTTIWGKILFASLPRSKETVPSSLSANQFLITSSTWSNSTNDLCDAYVGSPIEFKQNNQSYLLGILTVNCEATYLNIFNYRRWIEGNVQSNYDVCTTPENATRWCIPLDNCPVLLHAFANPKEKYEDYLGGYICSNDQLGGFQVCCPTSLDSTELQAESTGLNGLSNKQFCGYQHRDDYYSNDSSIALDEFPWLATVRAVNPLTNVEYIACSGSLINNRYVITSARCLSRLPQTALVRLGEYNVLNKTDCMFLTEIGTEDCSEYEDFGIETAVVHPFYDPWTYKNDIALIRLNGTVLFSETIRPICLPIPSLFKIADTTDEFYSSSFTSPKLWGTDYMKKKLYFSLTENEDCEHKHPLTRYQMCLRPKAMPTDRFLSCYDDEAAPAMISHRGQWTLEGISTERKSFCDASQPVVLSKISSYLPWLRENVLQNV